MIMYRIILFFIKYKQIEFMFSQSLDELNESYELMEEQSKDDSNNYGAKFFIDLITFLKTKAT